MCPHGDAMYRRYHCLSLVLWNLVGGMALTRTVSAQSTEPLLQLANLVYQGAFRLPQANCASNYACFSYGGTAVTYDAADNSLYIVGHPYGERSAEVSIPALVNSTTLSALKTATLLQQFGDPTKGKRTSVNSNTGTTDFIGGQLVYDGQLIVSVYSNYDGGGTQNTSHFVASLNLSNESQVAGPFQVGRQYPGFVSGYMTPVPSDWQGPLGGPALTGNCCLNIISTQSNGPAVAVFNPAQLGAGAPAPAKLLIAYPVSNPLGTGWGTQSKLFNGTTRITGVVFPPGTRSVLFFGRQGIGPFCYGEGTANSALTGRGTGDGGTWCYDPADSNKGTHAYPYVYQIWAYDANDLLAVKKRSKAPYRVRPYGVWTLDLPFSHPSDTHFIGGAAFDPEHNLIYVSQMGEDTNVNPIIQALLVKLSPAVPPTAQ